jgi:tRNA 2-selenouridine synthase
MNMPSTELSYFDFIDLNFDKSIPIIDVRSPVEFLKGAVPFSHNLPLFSNDERAEIGTLYKKKGPLEAVALGLEYFAASASEFLDRAIALKNTNSEIAVYCARGGMRSTFVTHLLASIGFKVLRLKGGYKDFRSDVLKKIDQLSAHQKYVLIGKTGSGKTEVLQALQGYPVLDFEDMAGHRGSALGGMAQSKSPATQQNFENILAFHYHQIKDKRFILVEHETTLGSVTIPHNLRLSLSASPMILLERTQEIRIEKLVELYFSNFGPEQLAQFEENMKLFRSYFSEKMKDKLISYARSGQYSELVKILLDEHYDKAYDKFLRKCTPLVFETLNLDAFDESLKTLKEKLSQ